MSLSDKFKKLKKEETEELEAPETPTPKIQKATKKSLPVKNITKAKIEIKTPKKVVKTKATLNNLKKVLDDTNITQDDLWMFLRILTRNKISTQRLPKSKLEPIFKDFINKKLKGAEQKE